MPIPDKPLCLSDDQLNALLAASYPLLPNRRSAFLEACARELANLPEIGEGAVHRIVSAVQRQFFDPPSFQTGDGKSKYSRRARAG
jgi:hypothetical protein